MKAFWQEWFSYLLDCNWVCTYSWEIKVESEIPVSQSTTAMVWMTNSWACLVVVGSEGAELMTSCEDTTELQTVTSAGHLRCSSQQIFFSLFYVLRFISFEERITIRWKTSKGELFHQIDTNEILFEKKKKRTGKFFCCCCLVVQSVVYGGRPTITKLVHHLALPQKLILFCFCCILIPTSPICICYCCSGGHTLTWCTDKRVSRCF